MKIKSVFMNYNHNDYISSYDGINVVDALEIRIEEVRKTMELVTNLNKWDYKYEKHKWSIKEVIQHCIDCERIFSFRALHIAREDKNILHFFDENKYVQNLDLEMIDPKKIQKEWLHLMNATLMQFEGFNNQTLSKTGLVEDQSYTIKKLGYMIAGHSIHHINVIKERYL